MPCSLSFLMEVVPETMELCRNASMSKRARTASMLAAQVAEAARTVAAAAHLTAMCAKSAVKAADEAMEKAHELQIMADEAAADVAVDLTKMNDEATDEHDTLVRAATPDSSWDNE